MWDLFVGYVGEHALAGLVGAFGHQVVYWGNRVRRNDFELKFRVLFYSLLYVVTGSGVGHFVGVDGGTSLLALGAGFTWPAFIHSIDAAKQIYQKFRSGSLSAGGANL